MAHDPPPLLLLCNGGLSFGNNYTHLIRSNGVSSMQQRKWTPPLIYRWCLTLKLRLPEIFEYSFKNVERLKADAFFLALILCILVSEKGRGPGGGCSVWSVKQRLYKLVVHKFQHPTLRMPGVCRFHGQDGHSWWAKHDPGPPLNAPPLPRDQGPPFNVPPHLATQVSLKCLQPPIPCPSKHIFSLTLWIW